MLKARARVNVKYSIIRRIIEYELIFGVNTERRKDLVIWRAIFMIKRAAQGVTGGVRSSAPPAPLSYVSLVAAPVEPFHI
jgi:hypothetical protein